MLTQSGSLFSFQPLRFAVRMRATNTTTASSFLLPTSAFPTERSCSQFTASSHPKRNSSFDLTHCPSQAHSFRPAPRSSPTTSFGPSRCATERRAEPRHAGICNSMPRMDPVTHRSPMPCACDHPPLGWRSGAVWKGSEMGQHPAGKTHGRLEDATCG